MAYRLYLFGYEYGWITYGKDKDKLEDILKILEDLDPYEYGQYMIINKLKDRDEIYDNGFIAKPHKKKLKPRK